jgi:hypothetical protein
MQRIIVPTAKHHSEELMPGVWFERFYPGGKNGPKGECLFNTPGGQGWTDSFVLGDNDDAFQALVPDIRLPANQLWPLHWHDCWTAVVILEGQCLIGDWWMQPGDLFIAAPSLEYGPLVIGPLGCRLFEIFAKAHLSRGGYAPEYRDHPTLKATQSVFKERSPLNKRNEGRQTLSCEGVDGFTKTRLSAGRQWELGEHGDPDRSILKDTRLAALERLPGHRYADWHALMILSGTVRIAGRTLGKDDYLTIRPNSLVGDMEAGAEGAQLLELSRTFRGARLPAQS